MIEQAIVNWTKYPSSCAFDLGELAALARSCES
jgi:hypothetical protein